MSEKAFVEDCPANPLPHLLATKRKTQNAGAITVSLYLTRECNLRCITCYISAGKKLKNELSQWTGILDKLHEIGVKYLYLLGGEPTLLGRNRLTAIVREAKGLGMEVGMSTNGTLDREMVKALKGAGLNQVQLSLDGATPEVNDRIRGRGTYSLVIKSAQIMKEEGMDFSTSMTLTSLNYYQALDFIKLSEGIGAKAATILVAQKFGRADEQILPSRDQVWLALKQISSHEANISLILNGFRFYLEDLVKVGSGLSSICPAGKSRFVIDSDGSVFGCELLMKKELYEGNALKDNLKEIWKNGFKWFRNRDLPGQCKACPIFQACGGGCPARSYGMNEKDPLCTL